MPGYHPPRVNQLSILFSAKDYDDLKECEIACKGFCDALDELYERIDKISEENVERLAKLAQLKRRYPYQREAVHFQKRTVRITNEAHENETANIDSDERRRSLNDIILTHFEYDSSEKSASLDSPKTK